MIKGLITTYHMTEAFQITHDTLLGSSASYKDALKSDCIFGINASNIELQ